MAIAVNAWGIYVPIFVDFSNMKAFISWLEKEFGNKISDQILNEIRNLETEAWVSPDFSTHIGYFTGGFWFSRLLYYLLVTY